jgi:inositol-phosphate transport system permease protein
MATLAQSVARAAPAVEWTALARASRRRRALTQGALLLFLCAVSAPVVLPYLWMFVIAVSARGGSVDTGVLWRAVAVLAPVGVACILAAAINVAERARRLALIAIAAAGLAVFLLAIGPALTWANYRFLWNPDLNALTRNMAGVNTDRLPSIWTALRNSFAFAAGQTLLVLAIATPAGYCLSRFAFPGRESYLKMLLVLHAFPAMTLIIPIFLLMHWTGLLDTLTGVVLVLCAIELPFAIFIMKGFFDGVPWDIEMSAMTDGATRLRAFLLVVLPQVRAGMLAVAVFAFLRGWEEYVFVRTLLYEKQNWTMSLYLFWVREDTMGVDQGLVAGVATLYVLPALLLYLFSQRYLMQMSVGGIKG